MAQKVSVQLVDDLDGSDAAESVTFGVDGVNYEIDLSTDNAQRLRDALSPYVAGGRKVSGSRKRGARGRSSATANTSGIDTNSVREWARANGYSVADRGRIKAEVLAAYEAANG